MPSGMRRRRENFFIETERRILFFSRNGNHEKFLAPSAMNNLSLAVQFFLQLAVILLFCRAVGAVAKRFGQPQVVAEMVAGVLLGPSLFGLLAPGWQHSLFPWDGTQKTRDTQSYLFPASQLGLALYMFVVGMEFRVDIVRRHLRSSVAVSVAGMAAPFALGAGLGWVFHEHTSLFPARTSLPEAMLFLGASMCITAFPMLARIIHFKKLAGTKMGTVALGAGALDDATAWCLLAVVLASFDRDWSHAWLNIGGGAGYVALVLLGVRPLLARLKPALVKEGTLTEAGLVVGLALMALGAWWTDFIGLHAVFGAFIMGAAMPRGVVARALIGRSRCCCRCFSRTRCSTRRSRCSTRFSCGCRARRCSRRRSWARPSRAGWRRGRRAFPTARRWASAC